MSETAGSRLVHRILSHKGGPPARWPDALLVLLFADVVAVTPAGSVLRVGLEALLVLFHGITLHAVAAVDITRAEFRRVSGEVYVGFLFRGAATECEDSEKCRADLFHVEGACLPRGGTARLLRMADKKTPDKGGNRALNTQKRVGKLELVVAAGAIPFVREARAHFIFSFSHYPKGTTEPLINLTRSPMLNGGRWFSYMVRTVPSSIRSVNTKFTAMRVSRPVPFNAA
jgi:hypothetical protein